MKRPLLALVLGLLLSPALVPTTGQATPPGFSAADVAGRYTFRFQGSTLALAGTFTADGNGLIVDIRFARTVNGGATAEFVQAGGSSLYSVDALGFGAMEWFFCEAPLCDPGTVDTLSLRFVVRDHGRTVEVIGSGEVVVSGTATRD